MSIDCMRDRSKHFEKIKYVIYCINNVNRLHWETEAKDLKFWSVQSIALRCKSIACKRKMNFYLWKAWVMILKHFFFIFEHLYLTIKVDNIIIPLNLLRALNEDIILRCLDAWSKCLPSLLAMVCLHQNKSLFVKLDFTARHNINK